MVSVQYNTVSFFPKFQVLDILWKFCFFWERNGTPSQTCPPPTPSPSPWIDYISGYGDEDEDEDKDEDEENYDDDDLRSSYRPTGIERDSGGSKNQLESCWSELQQDSGFLEFPSMMMTMTVVIYI